MALQFVNEMSRNNVAIMLNPQQISSTLASMAQQPVNTWLTQTSK
jgi:hypothetical protein